MMDETEYPARAVSPEPQSKTSRGFLWIVGVVASILVLPILVSYLWISWILEIWQAVLDTEIPPTRRIWLVLSRLGLLAACCGAVVLIKYLFFRDR